MEYSEQIEKFISTSSDLTQSYLSKIEDIDSKVNNKIQELEEWKENINLQNNNGIIKDLNGNTINQAIYTHKPIAFISAPVSFNDIYKANFKFNHTFLNGQHSTENNEYFEFVKDGDYFIGIKVLKNGIYECYGFQRGSGDDNSEYGVLSLNGNRGYLEDKYGDNVGPWAHDHSGGHLNWSKSYYYGELVVGDIISFGAASGDDGYLDYTGDAFTGQLSVKLITLT